MPRRKIVHDSSALRCENAGACRAVIAEQSTLSLLSRDGLLRGACHRARRRRDPVTRYDDPDTAGCLKFKSELCASRSGRALMQTSAVLRCTLPGSPHRVLLACQAEAAKQRRLVPLGRNLTHFTIHWINLYISLCAAERTHTPTHAPDVSRCGGM
jgi:hypothetical protein